MLSNMDLFDILVKAIVLITAIPAHELAHGWVAKKLGDPTASSMGRLTLNPIAHIDPFGAIMLLVTGYGWAKPIPVNVKYFKNIKRDMALVAIAGPLVNFLLAFVFMIAFKILIIATATTANVSNAVLAVSEIMSSMIVINIGLAVFNLLPLPPLDGSRLLTALLPKKLYFAFLKYERFVMIALLLLLMVGFLSLPIAIASNAVLGFMDSITGFLGYVT